MKISKENRKIIKYFASILWWYLFGLGTLAMIIVYYIPLNRDFGFSFGMFVTIALLLILLSDLFSIYEITKCKNK